MKLFPFIKLCVFASIVYITLGDAFLPQPHRANSKIVRNNINEYIAGLLPGQKTNYLRENSSELDSLDLSNIQQANQGSINSPIYEDLTTNY